MDLSLFFAGTAGSVPSARRGLPALLRAPRRRPHAVRLRRGHAAPAAAQRRAARHRRGLPHALPRRPLARPAGDAEDLRPARPRARRSTSSARPALRALLRDAAPRLRARSATRFDGHRARGRRRDRASTATRSQAFNVRHRGAAFGYAIVEDERPGRFDAELAARARRARSGPDFGRLQRGETVDGVAPEQVVGPERARPADRHLRRHRAVRHGPRGRRAAPTCSCTRRRSSRGARARARDRAQHRRARRPRSPREAGVRHARADAPVHAATRGREIREEARAVFEDAIVPARLRRVEVPFPERGEPELRCHDAQAEAAPA